MIRIGRRRARGQHRIETNAFLPASRLTVCASDPTAVPFGTATYYHLALSSSPLHTTGGTPIQACRPNNKRRHKCASRRSLSVFCFWCRVCLNWVYYGGDWGERQQENAVLRIFLRISYLVVRISRAGQGPRRSSLVTRGKRRYLVSRCSYLGPRGTGHGARATHVRIYPFTLLPAGVGSAQTFPVLRWFRARKASVGGRMWTSKSKEIDY